jgi:hypothetical protein
MMRKKRYLKDTKKFWDERNKARAALDKKRTKASHAEKAKIAKQIKLDALLLKTARPISSKS